MRVFVKSSINTINLSYTDFVQRVLKVSQPNKHSA